MAIPYGRARIARCAIIALALAAVACTQSLKLMKDDSDVVLSHQTISASNPADIGPFKVRRMFYGAGTDKQRPEYRDSVTIKTRTVDVSPFATVPPAQADERKEFWGFDMKKVPINGRVWYPEGDGPFPLVILVHGNHDYKDFSDPGYGYLGELLASHGFIFVSVDENFINGLREENDGRAWLLLKHFEAWKHFNDSAGGPFYHHVDMNNLAVGGHSRGGEAAPLAAAFNRLKYYPDDAKQKFNFGFAIKSVVSIAPVDGQYRPAAQFMHLENVNYLVIHGSHDGDVATFQGLRQFERARFTDGKALFKAAIFMYRANHGQWNTVWNSKDNGPRSGRSLDLRALIDPELQRQFARVVIAGFLEATMHGKREYLPMFRDHRTAGAWLPNTMYTTRFQDNGYHALAEYEEEIDLTTGTAPGVELAGDSLSTWKESNIPFRGRGGLPEASATSNDQRHNGVWLGWNRHIAGTDTTKRGRPASYSISVPDSLRSAWGIGEKSVVYFSLAVTRDTPGPRSAPRDSTRKDSTSSDSTKRQRAPNPPPKPKTKPDSTPVDLTIELIDAAGHTARLPMSRFGIARRPLDARIYRRAGRDDQRFANVFELVPQTFVMPIAEFAKSAPQFDHGKLKTKHVEFDHGGNYPTSGYRKTFHARSRISRRRRYPAHPTSPRVDIERPLPATSPQRSGSRAYVDSLRAASAAVSHRNHVCPRRHEVTRSHRSLKVGPHVARRPQVPRDTVESGDRSSREVRHGSACEVRHRDCDLAMIAGVLDVIGQHRAVRRILAAELIAVRSLDQPIEVADLRGGFGREEMHVFSEDLARDMGDCPSLIDDLETAALGRDDDVVHPRFDDDVVDGDRGQVAERVAQSATRGQRDPQSELGAGTTRSRCPDLRERGAQARLAAGCQERSRQVTPRPSVA